MATAITHFDVGDVWQPQATFTVGGVNTDPTTLTVRQQDAAGVETVLANAVDPAGLNASSTPVAKTATGVFKLNPGIALTASGYWFVKFQGTGAAAATEQQQVIVDPDEFTSDAGVSTRALVSLAETKAYLKQRTITTTDDLDLVRTINDISQRIHDEAEREFKPTTTNPATRTFETPRGGRRDPWYVDGQFMGDRNSWRRTVKVGDLASFTEVQIIDTDWTTVLETVTLTSVTGHPMVRQPWEPIRALEFSTAVAMLSDGMRVSVTGNWGFPAVPGNVRQAALEAISAVYDRDVENYRQDFANPAPGEAGNVIVVGGGGQRLLSLPPSALSVCWWYRDSVLA